jgi:hypothetical protein
VIITGNHKEDSMTTTFLLALAIGALNYAVKNNHMRVAVALRPQFRKNRPCAN